MIGDVSKAAASLGRELGAHLPLYLLLLCPIGLTRSLLARHVPPRPDLAVTALAPLAVFVAVQLLRIGALDAGVRHRRLGQFVLGLAVLFAFNAATLGPDPLSKAGIMGNFELWGIAWTVALAVWAARQPRGQLLLYYAVLLVVGSAVENGGIWLGLYSEEGYRWYVPGLPAPIATQGGWCAMLLIGGHVMHLVREHVAVVRGSIWLSALVAAASATSLDLLIDPFATEIGAWRWHPSLPPAWFGVPLLNFVGWMSTITATFVVLLGRAQRRGVDPAGPLPSGFLAEVLLWTPVVLLLFGALVGSLTALLEGGLDGPAWRLARASLSLLWTG